MISSKIKKLAVICLSLLFLVSCASKRYAKKGAEFENAGLFENAAEMYYLSVVKNPKNIEAQVGLKKNGQRTLNKKLNDFMAFYNTDDIKDAVYKYLEAVDFYDKVTKVGVQLEFPKNYNENYLEVKAIYLEKRYNEAYTLLEQEKFPESETIFNEILKIEPGYQKASELRNTAQFEPIYRNGKELLNIKKYRGSYYKFQEILTKVPNYKDSKELSDLALSNALITIAIVDFKNNTRQKGIELQIQSKIEKKIAELKSPFIKIVDRSHTEKITNEQLLTLEGKVDGPNSSKAGLMLGVKALLVGEIINYKTSAGELQKNEKKGYIKETIKPAEGSQDPVKYKYHKTVYYEFNQERTVLWEIQFKLISTETGEILTSDAFSFSTSDKINYATYEGNKTNLVPGYYESKDKNSPNDLVKDTPEEKRKLDQLLGGRQTIKSIDELSNDAQNEIAKQVAEKIKKYDPEN